MTMCMVSSVPGPAEEVRPGAAMLEPAAPGASYGFVVASEGGSSVIHRPGGRAYVPPGHSFVGGGRAEQNPRRIASASPPAGDVSESDGSGCPGRRYRPPYSASLRRG